MAQDACVHPLIKLSGQEQARKQASRKARQAQRKQTGRQAGTSKQASRQASSQHAMVIRQPSIKQTFRNKQTNMYKQATHLERHHQAGTVKSAQLPRQQN